MRRMFPSFPSGSVYVGDVGIVGLFLGEGPEPCVRDASAGFADDDAAVVFDFLDDGDVPVVGACAEIAFGEAGHVAELYVAAGRVSEFPGA